MKSTDPRRSLIGREPIALILSSPDESGFPMRCLDAYRPFAAARWCARVRQLFLRNTVIQPLTNISSDPDVTEIVENGQRQKLLSCEQSACWVARVEQFEEAKRGRTVSAL
ncbi:hypothetical protein [Bradyrhizobium sacchari]|nr:hypothetical protein [Bradyrhizobium sacchari]